MVDSYQLETMNVDKQYIINYGSPLYKYEATMKHKKLHGHFFASLAKVAIARDLANS